MQTRISRYWLFSIGLLLIIPNYGIRPSGQTADIELYFSKSVTKIPPEMNEMVFNYN